MLDNRTVIDVNTTTGITIPKDSLVVFIKMIQKRTKDNPIMIFTIIYCSHLYLVRTGFPISDILKELD